MGRFDTWSTSTDVTNTDIVVVSPVPFAFCDVELATAAYKTIAATRRALNVVGGGGSLWDVMDEAIGWSPLELLPEVETNRGRIVEPDLADQWSNPAFQPELAHILDRLFDLQNDPARQRVVLVVSGDSHIGGFHKITSPRPAHQANDRIYQVIASPIGTSPSSSLADALINADTFFDSFPIAHAGPGVRDFYRSKVEVVRGTRNFATLNVRRTGPGRTYEIKVALHTQATDQLPASELRLDLGVNLDQPGIPQPLFPNVSVTNLR